MDADDRKKIDAIRGAVPNLVLRRTELIQLRTEAARRAAEAEETSNAWAAARTILQEIAQEAQNRAHRHVAGVVSKCLAAIFDDPYELVIRIEKKRFRTEAVLAFRRDGEEYDPLDAAGGGVADAASFALRLVCLLSAKPPLRKLMVLDEPMKHVSGLRADQVFALLRTVAEEMGVQIIMTTHNEQFDPDGKAIRI